jgi:hypothetical protein
MYVCILVSTLVNMCQQLRCPSKISYNQGTTLHWLSCTKSDMMVSILLHYNLKTPMLPNRWSRIMLLAILNRGRKKNIYMHKNKTNLVSFLSSRISLNLWHVTRRLCLSISLKYSNIQTNTSYGKFTIFISTLHNFFNTTSTLHTCIFYSIIEYINQ